MKKTNRSKTALISRMAYVMLLVLTTLFSTQGALAENLVSQKILPIQDYYTITPDYRKCAYPMCGGFWIKPVNLNAMICPDGSKAQSCYVSKISELNDKVSDGKTLVHGEFSKAKIDVAGNYYQFDIDAIYPPYFKDNTTNVSSYNLIYNRGIVCIKALCPSLAIAKLNTKTKTAYFNYEFSKDFDKKLQKEVLANIWGAGDLVFGSWQYSADSETEQRTFLITNAFHSKGISTGGSCGGLLGEQCGLDQYCNFGRSCGAADEPGICVDQPQFCTMQYDPVCGCDGNTYSNACVAASSGISVVHNGPCNSSTFLEE